MKLISDSNMIKIKIFYRIIYSRKKKKWMNVSYWNDFRDIVFFFIFIYLYKIEFLPKI